MTRGTAREPVSELTTARLSIYLRCLGMLKGEKKTISSQELAESFGLNSAQIRKDLACFGDFGMRGVGYDVATLKQHLTRELGIDRTRNVVIVGAGHLGMALADYQGFNSNAFRIVALLDVDPSKTNTMTARGVPISAANRLEQIVREWNVEIGIIAVPTAAAQSVYDCLVDAHVPSILNFAPVRLRLRPGVKLKSVDLSMHLELLSYHLKSADAD